MTQILPTDHDLEELTTRMQDILRIAHGLKEATATFNSPSCSPIRTCDFDSRVNLPSPRPLSPSLLEAGASFEVASAVSQIYQRHAEQLRHGIQESIAAACQKVAELPRFASAIPPDILMKKLTHFFTGVYIRRLEGWTEQSIQRIKQTSKTPVEVASRNPRCFNHDYVPLLEHFFEENPFPTHADKMLLAKKSDMEYRQIHVWFQNRRNRTKKEGKLPKKKSTRESAVKLIDKPHERMKGHVPVGSDSRPTQPPKMRSAEGVTVNGVSNVFASSSPPHAFPSSYPPACHYDPFPCKSGHVYFPKPEWRRVPDEKPLLSLSTSIDDLVEKFSHLNVRDGTRTKGSPQLRLHAATLAITIIPSRAPHPSLILGKYSEPTNIVRPLLSVRAPISCSKAFEYRNPTTPVTLVPPPAPPKKGKPLAKRKIAPLPQRFPSRMRDTHRDTTPSEGSSTSSSSPYLLFTDAKSRNCSFSSPSSLSTSSDIAEELPRSFGSPCRLPVEGPVRLHGLGDMVAISLSSIS